MPFEPQHLRLVILASRLTRCAALAVETPHTGLTAVRILLCCAKPVANTRVDNPRSHLLHSQQHRFCECEHCLLHDLPANPRRQPILSPACPALPPLQPWLYVLSVLTPLLIKFKTRPTPPLSAQCCLHLAATSNSKTLDAYDPDHRRLSKPLYDPGEASFNVPKAPIRYN